MYQLVLFDLDGTLTDPGVGITNSVAHALKKFGLAVPERAALYKFIGPPLHESFERYYGFSQEQAQTAVAYYREYFREKGIYENFVYDGVEELLKALRGAGRTLAVATSKPEVFAKQILEHFHLDPYFTYVAGANLDGTRTRKDQVIACALRGCGVEAPAAAVMVGDRNTTYGGPASKAWTPLGCCTAMGAKPSCKRPGPPTLRRGLGIFSPL
jgi:phosphoglycolate phosphatase